MGAFFFTVHMRGADLSGGAAGSGDDVDVDAQVERVAAVAATVLSSDGTPGAVEAAAGRGGSARAAIGRAAGDGGWLTLLPAFAFESGPALGRLGAALGAPLVSTVTADSDAWFATVYAGGAVVAACASDSDDLRARDELRAAVARHFGTQLDDAWLRDLLVGRRTDEERRMDAFARALGITSAANQLDALLRAGRAVGLAPASLRYVVAPMA